MINRVPESLKKLAKEINMPIYIVGGFTRNFFASVSFDATDIDICGSFDIDLLRSDDSFRITSINKKLGTCQIKTNDAVFEYTRFRLEKYEGGAHTPTSVEFHDSIQLDASRRDFTINSIYYDVNDDIFIDPLGGIEDIKNKVIRTAASDTFEKDGLRIMRAVRFAAELGFDIQKECSNMLKSQAYLLADISPDRKRDELEKILHADEKYGVADAHYNGLKLMQRFDVFPYILPDIKALEGVKQNPKYHLFDCLEHTLLTVKHARQDVRLAALMHDTGKPASLDSEGHMKGHNVVSEKIARTALGRNCLNYSNRVIEETARLCYNHMYDLKGDTSNSKMRIFVAENFDIIDKIAALREADGKATGMPQNHKFNRFLEFKNILLEENAPINIKDLEISGDVLEEYGIPHKERTRILKELLNACIIDPKLNNATWLTAQIKKAARDFAG